MNNAAIINSFNSDDNNVANINTEHKYIMTNITHRILKFESVMKRSVATNHTYFVVVIISKINLFAYINYIFTQNLNDLFLQINEIDFDWSQKDCHQ